MIYLTMFDPETKRPTAPSAATGVSTLAEAARLMPGEPVKVTRNMRIYAGGVCLSWIRFAV